MNPQDPQPAVRWEVAGFVLGLTVNWNSQSGRLRLPDFSIITVSAAAAAAVKNTVSRVCMQSRRTRFLLQETFCFSYQSVQEDAVHRYLPSDIRLLPIFDLLHTFFHSNDAKKMYFLIFFSFQMHHHCKNTFSQSHEKLCSDGPRPTGSDFATQLIPSTTFLFFLPLLLVSCAWRQRTGASPAATAPQLKLFLQFRGEKVEFTAKG